MRWTGSEEGDIEVDDEFDDPPPGSDDPPAPATAPEESTDE